MSKPSPFKDIALELHDELRQTLKEALSATYVYNPMFEAGEAWKATGEREERPDWTIRMMAVETLIRLGTDDSEEPPTDNPVNQPSIL